MKRRIVCFNGKAIIKVIIDKYEAFKNNEINTAKLKYQTFDDWLSALRDENTAMLKKVKNPLKKQVGKAVEKSIAYIMQTYEDAVASGSTWGLYEHCLTLI